MTLNPRLADELERLATDLRVDRHGDPHLAFVVLLHPDRPGTVLLVGHEGHPPADVTQVQLRKPGTPTSKRSPFPIKELERAGHAIDDALLGMRIYTPSRHGDDIGGCVRDHMQTSWERRQMAPITRELERAAYEAAHPALCEFCDNRFTTRGLPRHQRSCYRNPGAEQYGPNGDRVPTIRGGRVVGWELRS